MTVRVVLADDHAIFSSGARLLLEHDPTLLVVSTVTTPDALIAYLATNQCDLVVTDFNMPGESTSDGLELLALLRSRFGHIPIIVLTMLSNPGLLRSIVETGVEGLVNKTDAVVQLPLAVRTVMNGRRYLSKGVLELLEVGSDEVEFDKLTAKEAEILALIASGKSVSDIALLLGRSVKTISTQKMAAMEKLGLRSDLELYAYAREHRLV